MKVVELITELNKRGNLPNKILVRDIRSLWEAGWITANKPAREYGIRIKIKIQEVKFNDIKKIEKEILDFLKKMKEKGVKNDK